jgi:hypothetical protein
MQNFNNIVFQPIVLTAMRVLGGNECVPSEDVPLALTA